MKKSKSGKTALVLWGATDLGPPHFSGDLLWRTGFKAPDPFVLVEIFEDEKSYLLVSPLELERAAKEVNKGIETVNAHIYQTKNRGHLENFLKKHDVKKVVVPDTFPCNLHAKLTKSFKVMVADSPFYPKRAIKTDWEVTEIEKAQRAVEFAVRKAMDFLKTCYIFGGQVFRDLDFGHDHPVTSELVRKVIDGELFSQGYLGIDTIVACGAQAADPHCAGSGSLFAHQPIVIDVFPLSLKTHYYADMTRTAFKGAPSKEFKRMYEAVLWAQTFAIRDVKAGVDGCEIYNATLEYFKVHAYPTDFAKRPMEGFFHGVGHGVGIDIHEPPWINSSKCILEEGHIVTVEPGLYYQTARDHIPVGGIRIEDMVLVTKDGCRNLTNFPKDLESMIIP